MSLTLDDFNALQKCKEKIMSITDYRNGISTQIETYRCAKEILKKDLSMEEVNCISTILYYTEFYMPSAYIMDVKSKFSAIGDKSFMTVYEIIKQIPKEFSSKKELLDTIVSTVRNIIFYKYRFQDSFTYENFEAISFLDLCKEVSYWVNEVCKFMKVKSEIIRIDPGFNQELNLVDGNGFHYFNIITIENERVLVDLSYKQFFTIKGNNLERLGVLKSTGCLAGIYMIQNESRLTTAKTLLLNGWIELTEENMKNYFDGFALSYRNALYYDNLGCVDFTTKYTACDYENFIYGDDNQANHENIRMLGIQDARLNNLNLDFISGHRYFECESDNEFVKQIYLNIKR